MRDSYSAIREELHCLRREFNNLSVRYSRLLNDQDLEKVSQCTAFAILGGHRVRCDGRNHHEEATYTRKTTEAHFTVTEGQYIFWATNV